MRAMKDYGCCMARSNSHAVSGWRAFWFVCCSHQIRVLTQASSTCFVRAAGPWLLPAPGHRGMQSTGAVAGPGLEGDHALPEAYGEAIQMLSRHPWPERLAIVPGFRSAASWWCFWRCF